MSGSATFARPDGCREGRCPLSASRCVAIIRQLPRGNPHSPRATLLWERQADDAIPATEAGQPARSNNRPNIVPLTRTPEDSEQGPADRATSELTRQLPLFSRACDASVCGVAGFFDERVIRSTVRSSAPSYRSSWSHIFLAAL